MKKPRRSFCSFLQINNILCGINEQDGKAVLEMLISTLLKHSPGLDADFVRKEVESREALYQTMIAPGLAVPHARIPGLSQALTAMACIPAGCEFGGDSKAKVMILLLTPVDDPNMHIQLFSALAVEFIDPEVMEKIAAMETPQDVFDHFLRHAADMPDFLKAADEAAF